ncbi:MAG TPA: hypothetical protein VHJ18_05835 [Streptosporangiaceae bacterium]|nr:hypothetical protein [Streptosporangiaceae bacterium]
MSDRGLVLLVATLSSAHHAARRVASWLAPARTRHNGGHGTTQHDNPAA